MQGTKNQPQPLFPAVDQSHGWVDPTGWPLQSAPDLNPDSWTDLAGVITATGPTTRFPDPVAPSESADFHRLKVLSEPAP